MSLYMKGSRMDQKTRQAMIPMDRDSSRITEDPTPYLRAMLASCLFAEGEVE